MNTSPALSTATPWGFGKTGVDLVCTPAGVHHDHPAHVVGTTNKSPALSTATSDGPLESESADRRLRAIRRHFDHLAVAVFGRRTHRRCCPPPSPVGSPIASRSAAARRPRLNFSTRRSSAVNTSPALSTATPGDRQDRWRPSSARLLASPRRPALLPVSAMNTSPEVSTATPGSRSPVADRDTRAGRLHARPAGAEFSAAAVGGRDRVRPRGGGSRW